MATKHSTDQHGANMYPLRDDWLALQQEEVIEPDLPIIDPHHHLWERSTVRYLLDELLDDITTGHDIRSTIFIQCRSMFRADGPVEMQPLGETEFVNGIAAQSASGNYGPIRCCDGIVSYADLRRGAATRAVLEAHTRLSHRFRGIRFSTAWDEEVEITPQKPPRHMMADAKWREGFGQLAPLGVTFDALLFHHQIGELTDLARAFPQTTIVLDHIGIPAGVGPYSGKRDEIFTQWRTAITELGKCENVYVKLGGLAMPVFGFGFEKQPKPPSSQDLAQAWKPYVETCISAFTPKRAMFESNFPVDKVSTSYRVIWNAFKRLASGASADEKAWLFHSAAAKAYRLDDVSSQRPLAKAKVTGDTA